MLSGMNYSESKEGKGAERTTLRTLCRRFLATPLEMNESQGLTFAGHSLDCISQLSSDDGRQQ